MVVSPILRYRHEKKKRKNYESRLTSEMSPNKLEARYCTEIDKHEKASRKYEAG